MNKILSFSTCPTNLPDICALEHHLIEYEDREYLLEFIDAEITDTNAKDVIQGDNVTVKFSLLYRKPEYQPEEVKMFRCYPKIHTSELLKYSEPRGFMLYGDRKDLV